MKVITVETSKRYEVLIGDGLIERAGELCANVVSPCKAVIISDDVVAKHYMDAVSQSFGQAGYQLSQFVFCSGEAQKNISTLGEILEFLAGQQLTRSDLIIALGGGVVGDIAGFAASVYLRGIRFVQIPTTLLAQVDSSVGGKTAVDLVAGKNLAGAFYQPELVVCDVNTLQTLPPDIFSGGMAEVIKYGVVFDEELFQALSGEYDLTDVIYRCICLKRDVVQGDEFDRGERQLLNFGHTIGHAIERLSHYSISHGQAVAIGMVICARGSFGMGFCMQDYSQNIIRLLKRYNLPASCSYSAEQLYEACLVDKKRSAEVITMVIPERIGRCVLRKTMLDEVYALIGKGVG